MFNQYSLAKNPNNMSEEKVLAKYDDGNWDTYFETVDLCKYPEVEKCCHDHIQSIANGLSVEKRNACELGCGDGSFGRQLTGLSSLVSVDPFAVDSSAVHMTANAYLELLIDKSERKDLIFGKFFMHFCGSVTDFFSLVRSCLRDESSVAVFYSMSEESPMFGNSEFNKHFFAGFPVEHRTMHTGMLTIPLQLDKKVLTDMLTRRVWSTFRTFSQESIDHMCRLVENEMEGFIDLWINVFEVRCTDDLSKVLYAQDGSAGPEKISNCQTVK